MKIKIRRYLEDDKNFIYSSIKQQLYEHKTSKKSKVNNYHLMEYKDFNDGMERILDKIIRKYDVSILCPEDAEFQILAYLIHSEIYNSIIYCYTKKLYRENGLMKKLIDNVFDIPPIYYCFRSRDKNFRKYIEKYAVNYLPFEMLE